MPEHQDWFSVLLGHTWENLTKIVRGLVGDYSWLDHQPIEIHHVAGTVLVFLLTMFLAFRASAAHKASADKGLVPDKTFTARNFFDIFCEMILGQMEKQMGRERAKKYFPLIASFALFILFCNCLGLIPGFLPPTDKLNTTVPLAVTSFLAYNIYGFAAQGVGYLKHFCGPILPDLSKPKTYPAFLLVVLLLPIEIFGNAARVLSLSVRLMVNLFADHVVLGIFYTMFALFVPLPLMVLGVLVCVIQTAVFTLLSISYINLATEHGDHGEHGHEHAAEHAAH